jgi:antitoxin MazE
MQVAKWGNSLAVRFPAKLVDALGLKEGEEVELHLVGERRFEVSKKPAPAELVARLRQLRGRLPADFHFNRLEANEEAS